MVMSKQCHCSRKGVNKGLWEDPSKTDVAEELFEQRDPLCGHSAKVEYNVWVVLSCCKVTETIRAGKQTPWDSFFGEHEN